jgi:group I intron endonuclease
MLIDQTANGKADGQMNTDRTYSVYVLTSPSGRRYVGMTSSKPVSERWGPNGCRYKGSLFYPEIEQYGWENIKREVPYLDIPFHDAEEKERELIRTYRTTEREYGCNIALGGMTGKCTSQSTREKIRQWNYAHPETAERMRWYGQHKTPEVIEKIRRAATGVKQSPETIEKRAKAMRGRKQTPDAIKNMIAAQHDRPWEEKRVAACLAASEKKVSQYTSSGRYIGTYESATKAAKANNISNSSISRCCRGERLTYKGYIWRYD